MGTVASALISSPVYVAGQLPGSTRTSPVIAFGFSNAACSGNTPDCECPTTTAPFNCAASSESALIVDVDVVPRNMSGTPCFESSSTAIRGNWLSENGWSAATPKRKLGQTPSSLNRSQTGSSVGGFEPART